LYFCHQRSFWLTKSRRPALKKGEPKWNSATFNKAHSHKYRALSEKEKEKYRTNLVGIRHQHKQKTSRRKAAKSAYTDVSTTWKAITNMVSCLGVIALLLGIGT
jgi:hypothetical protein